MKTLVGLQLSTNSHSAHTRPQRPPPPNAELQIESHTLTFCEGGTGGCSRRDHGSVSGSTWGANSCWGSVGAGDRSRTAEQARLRRRCHHSRGGGAGLLGLRCYPPGASLSRSPGPAASHPAASPLESHPLERHPPFVTSLSSPPFRHPPFITPISSNPFRQTPLVTPLSVTPFATSQEWRPLRLSLRVTSADFSKPLNCVCVLRQHWRRRGCHWPSPTRRGVCL